MEGKKGMEKKGHIEGEHWPGALLRALPSFSPFFRRLSERRNRHEMKRTKPTFYMDLWERLSQWCHI